MCVLHRGQQVLKRIQTLRNVGRFKNCNSASVEFGRITFLYGRNRYGKSTLGDVFASIQHQDGELVTGRMTIPADGNPQHISLSLIPVDQSKEVPFTFNNGSWAGDLPAGLGIRTFDDGFIHRNVIVGRQFNRETKENFSAFVLGEQGVKQATAIAEKKQARQQANRDRNHLVSSIFKDVGDLQSFLDLSPQGTLEESQERLQSLRNERVTIRGQQEKTQAIQARDEGVSLHWSTNFSDGLNRLNQALDRSLESAHKEAKARVAEHIAATFQQSQGAEQWIREGVKQSKGELCQFCGQELSEDAHHLLEIYRQAFDDAFDNHDASVKQELEAGLALAGRLPLNGLRLTLARNRAAFAAFQEIQDIQSYASSVAQVAEHEGKIETALRAIEKELPDALSRLGAASEKKKEAPHTALEAIDEASIKSLEGQVLELVNSYNTWVEKCNAEISTFKKATNADALAERLRRVDENGKAENRINSRIRFSSACERYKALSTEINSLGEEIGALEEKLRIDQSEFLDKFFESLNDWFSRFGSHDFTLELGQTSKGHIPVYFLKVRYKGELVPEASLSRVFSESDRRALALAVFWTQLLSLPEPVLAEQIVVLDDPLTSFDDHRVTAVHRELVAAVDKVRQVIVLSHYRHDIEMFFEVFRDHPDARLLTLVPDAANDTIISIGDKRDFLLTKHQLAHERLLAFAEGRTNEIALGNLRVFFEGELDSRFANQIAQHKLSALQLGEKIDKLYETGVIDEATKAGCHTWRQTLNPSHHAWVGADLEDQRNTVRSFLEFVYTRLHCKA